MTLGDQALKPHDGAAEGTREPLGPLWHPHHAAQLNSARKEHVRMAQEVQLGRGGLGKIRSFWVGLVLTILTLGIYSACWYYFVNDELKDIGASNDDPNLASSSPMTSVLALILGGWLIVPPLLSVYNYGQRIRRAQTVTGVPEAERINPLVAFLLIFPGSLLLVPYFIHFWYVTQHQNRALRAAGNPNPALGTPAVPALS
jgi:hypothetical protein